MSIDQKQLRVCVVMPAYNEMSVIGKVVSNVAKTFQNAPYLVEIVVINDASNDKTGFIAHKNGAVVINHILNSGAGSATATGLRYARQNKFDIVATMDADGQHDPIDVLKGIDKIIKIGDDLLIGSRLIDSRGMSKSKVIGNKGLSLITYIIFGVYSTDSQSGLRIFSHNALEKLSWQTSGYEFCSEMLWRAKQQRLLISEYSIKAIYTDYSKSKGQNNWNAINIIKSLIKRRLTELLG